MTNPQYPSQPGQPGQQPPPGPQPPPGGFPPAPPEMGAPYGGYSTQAPLSSKGKRFGGYLLEALLVIVTCGIGWLIWWLVVMAKGQTPAKQLLKMRCVDANTGVCATYGQMALREVVGKMLLGLIPFYTLISAIFVLADERSQGLWDKVATTVVVDDPFDQLAPQ